MKMPHPNRPTSRRRRARIRRYRRMLVIFGIAEPLRQRGESLARYEDRLFSRCATATIEGTHGTD